MHTCWASVLMEVRSPYVRDTSGGASLTLSTTPLTLIPMLSLVGWSFTFYFSVGFGKFLWGYSTLKQPALLFIQCQYFWAPKEMTVLVSHCVAAPHKSRGALQLCPTFKGWKIVAITKNSRLFSYSLSRDTVCHFLWEGVICICMLIWQSSLFVNTWWILHQQ